jgi:alkylhydroperoxidase/carboxymuconolactone decarboxylase family protein YurZ
VTVPEYRKERTQMATQEEKQAYIDEMVRKRGYVLDYHKVMAAHDYEVLQAANGLVNAAYLEQRRLDRKTIELIFIASLTVMRTSKGHIQSHIRVALWQKPRMVARYPRHNPPWSLLKFRRALGEIDIILDSVTVLSKYGETCWGRSRKLCRYGTAHRWRASLPTFLV